MADLFASQLNAFKKSIKSSASSIPGQRKSPSKANTLLKRNHAAISSDNHSDTPKPTKRLKTVPIVSSTIPESTGGYSAHELSLKLVSATDYIKTCDRPVTLDELSVHMKTQIDSQILNLISGLDRYHYNPQKKTLEYLSLHNIKTGEDLLKVLESQPTFQGLSVKQLKDGWNGCLDTIYKLEKQNKIIIHKTKKENAPRHIWLNIGQMKVGNVVDEEFYESWGKIKVPKGADELTKVLLANNLKPTNVDPESIKDKKVAPVQQRRQKKPRRGKITNIHMKGILKNYSA
ncbi:unnamed protein product [Ambrosiozyma monospora]|uniref:Transcription initiation factor IIE subunit beta n=1 Tax=Ambrosiozyma monospora TaxID=43982 RepID=A0A9W6YT50_AMBMO|nr:unnamed protein product [Ambrosiozyma monospora]